MPLSMARIALLAVTTARAGAFVAGRHSSAPRLLAQRFRGGARASTVVEGEVGTDSYKLFFTEGDKKISPWHDIPLQPDGADKDVFNMVVEIPKARGAGARAEIARERRRRASRSPGRRRPRRLLHALRSPARSPSRSPARVWRALRR